MTIYDFIVKDTQQNDVKLDQYKNKVLLIVNTATGCGFTPQYEQLEVLYKTYKDKGFEILDFPCNQFLNQAKGSDESLASFCQINFNTTFQTFAKISVNGKNAHPLYQFLKQNAPIDPAQNSGLKKVLPNALKTRIPWNFTKFLIDRNGQVFNRYSPNFEPKNLSTDIDKLI